MMAERGVFVDHAAVHRWAIQILPLLAAVFRRRKRPVGMSWRMDESVSRRRDSANAVDTTAAAIRRVKLEMTFPFEAGLSPPAELLPPYTQRWCGFRSAPTRQVDLLVHADSVCVIPLLSHRSQWYCQSSGRVAFSVASSHPLLWDAPIFWHRRTSKRGGWKLALTPL